MPDTGQDLSTALADRYRVVRKLAEGGMSAIYEAQHTKLNRSFALKALLPRLAVNDEAVQRFEREAELLASLRHPKEEIRDAERLARTVAELWARGGEIDWRRYFGSERRRKVELPTYPFERQRFFLEARPGFFDFTQGRMKPASLAGTRRGAGPPRCARSSSPSATASTSSTCSKR